MKLFNYLALPIIALTFCFSVAAQQDEIPIAPFPSEVVEAKKVFILWGGGPDYMYDLLHSELKKWGRFSLVGRASEADLVFDVSLFPPLSEFYASGRSEFIFGLRFTILGAKEKNHLWSTSIFSRDSIFGVRMDPKRKEHPVFSLVNILKKRLETKPD